jgi:hypothetical protein
MRTKQIAGESTEPKRKTNPTKFSGDYCSITIHKDGGIDGKDDVPVGVEGRVLKIKRGEKVRIPVEHYEHLVNCKYSTHDHLGNPTGEIPRFSVTFHGYDRKAIEA